MKSLFLVETPAFCSSIAESLLQVDWIVHNFRENDPIKIVDPAYYIYNKEVDGVRYQTHLDLNVLQFIVNSIKRQKALPQYRAGIALLVFCRCADIEIEPSLAIYERINYNQSNLEEALDELVLLRSLDNADVNQLAKYALGEIDELHDVIRRPLADRAEIGSALTQYKRLTDWDSIYLLVLGVVKTYWDERVKKPRKLETYIDWMLKEFRLSLPCIVYAICAFGLRPMARMMKYRPDFSEIEKRAAVFNMTWDLFHINHFFKLWVEPSKRLEHLFVTSDGVLRTMMRLAIGLQYDAGDWCPMSPYLSQAQLVAVRTTVDGRSDRIDRVYGTEAWSPDYRRERIHELEASLFGC